MDVNINKYRKIIHVEHSKTKYWIKNIVKYEVQTTYGSGMPANYPFQFRLNSGNKWGSIQYRNCTSNCKLGYFYNFTHMTNVLRETTPKIAKEIVNELFSFGLRQTIFGTCHLRELNTIKKYFDLAYAIKVPSGYGKDIGNHNYYIYHILILNPYNTNHIKDEGKSIKIRVSSKKKEWPIDMPTVELINTIKKT